MQFKHGNFAVLFVLSAVFSLPSFADHWDRNAQEGEACSSGYGYRQCDYNLVCISNGRGYDTGVCRRNCQSTYDCHAGQSCQSYGYGRGGVCVDSWGGGGGGGWGGGGWNPGRPDNGYGAGPGQACSAQGYPYPRCERPYACSNPDRNGIGVCSSRCRSDYDCYNGGRCYAGSCYEGRGPRRY